MGLQPCCACYLGENVTMLASTDLRCLVLIHRSARPAAAGSNHCCQHPPSINVPLAARRAGGGCRCKQLPMQVPPPPPPRSRPLQRACRCLCVMPRPHGHIHHALLPGTGQKGKNTRVRESVDSAEPHIGFRIVGARGEGELLMCVKIRPLGPSEAFKNLSQSWF